MNKYIIFIITILTFSNMCNAQNQDKLEPINISGIISYDQFQEIKQFVLDKEQTCTYCQMYNNNPCYEFREGNSDRIELYLDPILQFLKEEDQTKPEMYDKITLFVKFRSKEYESYDYIHLSQDMASKEVYLVPHWETKERLEQKARQFEKTAQCILEEINGSKN